MQQREITDILGIIAYIVVLIVHTIGFTSLLMIKASRRLSLQQRSYLINLSIIEILFCVSGIAIRASHLAKSNRLNYYILVVTGCGFGLWYFLVMTLLTVDRFLAVYLDIHYDTKWPYSRNKLLLGVVFALSASVTTAVFATKPRPERLANNLEMYAWPSAHAVLLAVVVLTYGYLCRKIRQHRAQFKRNRNSLRRDHIPLKTQKKVKKQHHKLKQHHPKKQHSQKKQTDRIDSNGSSGDGHLLLQSNNVTSIIAASTAENNGAKYSPLQRLSNSFRRGRSAADASFRKAKRGFFLPNLLIASFIVFWMLPDLIYFGCRLNGGAPLKERSMLVDGLVSLTYTIGLFLDAVIYIFAVPEVRRVLTRKLKFKFFSR